MLRRQGAKAKSFHLTPHRCGCSIPGSSQGGPTSPVCPSLVPSGGCLPSGFWHFFFPSVLALHTLGQEAVLWHHPKFPTWRAQCHGNTLFFQLLPCFLCSWALSLDDGDHRSYLGRFSMLLSKQLIVWCLVVACPAMCPTPPHPPWPQHRGKHITWDWKDCSALHILKFP